MVFIGYSYQKNMLNEESLDRDAIIVLSTEREGVG